jgi:hypothetical protein
MADIRHNGTFLKRPIFNMNRYVDMATTRNVAFRNKPQIRSINIDLIFIIFHSRIHQNWKYEWDNTEWHYESCIVMLWPYIRRLNGFRSDNLGTVLLNWFIWVPYRRLFWRNPSTYALINSHYMLNSMCNYQHSQNRNNNNWKQKNSWPTV